MKAIGVAIALLALAGCRTSEEQRPAFLSVSVTKGKSMLPAFSELEPVWLEHCRWTDLKAGDTVIFWSSEWRIYVHHRLMERRLNGWVTRGDNNGGNDPGLMTADEFVGRTHKLNLGG